MNKSSRRLSDLLRDEDLEFRNKRESKKYFKIEKNLNF